MGHHLKFSVIKDCVTGAKSCVRRHRLWSKQRNSLFHSIDSQSVCHKWPQLTICRHNSSHACTKGTRSWSYTDRFIEKRSYSQSVSDADSVRKFILDNTELSKDHLTPEIALYLITPKCRLWWSGDEDCGVEDPFWAFYWPGGQALTRYLLDQRDVTYGRRVLDVGSGCGASAIAAHMSGASHVTANDICPVAATAIQLNADANDMTVNVITDNLIGQPLSGWDVVLLGDMFYDSQFAETVTQWIETLHANNAVVLIGDPGRVAFKENRIHNHLKLVYQRELPPTSKEENYGLTHGFVWQYSPS